MTSLKNLNPMENNFKDGEMRNPFAPPKGYQPTESLPTIDTDEFIKVVETRRAVRRFTQEAVPEEIIDRCLELALLSPNSCNLQPWEFVKINNEKIREEINIACMNQNSARTAPNMIAVVARTDTWKRNAVDMLKYWPEPEVPKAVEKMLTKDIVFQYDLGWFGLKGIFKRLVYRAIGLKQPIWQGPVTIAEREEWATKTTALAAQTLMLAVRAFGYDTCPIEGFDRRRVDRILNLSKEEKVIMFVSIGKRAEDGLYQQRVRLPNSQFIREV